MKKAYGATRVSTTLGVPRSTLYDRIARLARPASQAHRRLLREIREIHRQTRGSYGRRRMSQELRQRSFDVGPFRARQLMREAGLRVRAARPPIYPRSQGKPDAVAPNLLDRQFDVTTPGTVFAGDITYIWTRQKWLYLAIVMDLASRRIVGWATSDTPDTQLTMRALRLALPQRHTEQTLLFHSDQGCQYTSEAFRTFLGQHDVTQSMSRRGNCWDNAPVERFFHSLKGEWLGETVHDTQSQARQDIDRYIAGFYNTHRLHAAAGGKPPAVRHAELRKAA